ncbi:7634_t:CDS:2 [Entrophospora sp. SA101]|nr:7634_t:CDS:2 [Entrophospora sp. SA101]
MDEPKSFKGQFSKIEGNRESVLPEETRGALELLRTLFIKKQSK